jgi:hypothetical protein
MNAADTDGIRFRVPAAVIADTEELLVESGVQGFEGAVVWIGTSAGTTAHVTRVARPEQVAVATKHGLSVTLTEDGLTDLIASLGADEIVLARLHTHGNDDVDHSDVDDANLVVAHPGAVSIVVARLATHGIDLTACGVHILSATHKWKRLTAVETARRFEIT